MISRRYSELVTLPTLIERYEYCRLGAKVGDATFSGHRLLNQALYQSDEWRKFRQKVLIRDDGCEFGLDGYLIVDRPTVHHLVPLTIEMIENRDPLIFDMENVVCVSSLTHQAIHYGDNSLLPKDYVGRSQNDTCPWK